MRLSRLALALVLSPLLAVMAGCTNGEKPIRVSVFTTDHVLVKILADTIKSIETTRPDIKVKVENIPYNEYQDKLTILLAANNAPDVISIEAGNFSDLYLRDAFEDLTPYFERDKMDPKAYYPTALKRFSPGGKIYALPSDIAPIGLLYYNKKIFDEAGVPYPTSKLQWPEPFLSMCKKLVKKDADGKQVRWAYADPYGPQADDFFLSNGGYYMDSEENPTRMALDDPRVMEAYRFRVDMIYKWHVSPTNSEVQNYSFNNGAEGMFMNGKVAMMCSGLWHTPTFLEKGIPFDVVEFPKGPGGKRGWQSGGTGYAIWKGCKDKEKAWEVVKALAGEELVSKLAATGMIQPALIQVAKSDAFLKSPGAANKKILLDMPKYSHYMPFVKGWAEIWYGQVGPALDPMWLGNKTPEEVIPRLNADLNKRYFGKK
ncbi:MAG TPA: sugar ABC transporter substrate-binding protein [bacterium]|nr:sugar ABC transporter substrate-binding protein [bacterium]